MHIKRIPPHLSWHLYFIDQHPKLVVVCINGGLTSVIQLCDLISNKDLKQAIRVGHYEKEIKIAEIGDSPNNAHIKFKMPIDEMAVIAEYGVKEFNIKQHQHSANSVRKMFRKVNQDSGNDCEAELKAHRASASLQKNSMYKTLCTTAARHQIWRGVNSSLVLCFIIMFKC